MRTRGETREAGRLRYHRVTAATAPDLAVLLCHGFGAPGTDLVPIANELVHMSERIAKHVVFLFPEAPLSLGGFPGFEQRAWWPIDLPALEESIRRGQPLDRGMECPGQLAELRPRLLELLARERAEIGELLREMGPRPGAGDEGDVLGVAGRFAGGGDGGPLPTGRIVLGGFSQGAMLATDLTLHMDEAPGALVAFSGTLLCETEWRRLAPGRKGLKVLQSHGRHDPLLAFPAAERLRDLLRSGGAELRFVPFDGQHEIPPIAMNAFRDLLEELVAPTREESR